jgi:hypothetical protein
MQLYNSSSDCKGVGRYSRKPLCEILFSSSVAFLIMSVVCSLFSVEKTGKNQLQPGQESMWDAAVLSNSSSLKNP